AGWSAAASRGGGTGRRAGSGSGRTRGHYVLDFSTIIAQQLQNLLPTIAAQVDNQDDHIQGDVRMPLKAMIAAVGMSWEDFRTLTREEFCPSNEMQKLENELWNHAMVGAGHAVYACDFYILSTLLTNNPYEVIAALHQYLLLVLF
ncbi:hypothetical protein Tco_0815217, partial [Tanacetum coccineum]